MDLNYRLVTLLIRYIDKPIFLWKKFNLIKNEEKIEILNEFAMNK